MPRPSARPRCWGGRRSRASWWPGCPSWRRTGRPTVRRCAPPVTSPTPNSTAESEEPRGDRHVRAGDPRHRARRRPSDRNPREVPMTTQAVQALEVQGLEKSYKQVRALRGVDFEVARGSIFALLGANGAGKTTVVNILSTLLKPDAGTATVAGFDLATHPAEVRAAISLTGQFAAVDEALSGGGNLVLVARVRSVPAAGQLADALLERFQLTDAATRKVATYSGGMRRRLDIAMSLIGNPPVIFLDAPTTGLDPQGRL